MDTRLSNDDVYFPGKVLACFEEGGNATVTFKDLAQVVETIIDGFRASSLKRDAEIAELRAEIAALKNAWPDYKGVWSAGKTYQKNWTVTHAGSLWVALKTTAAYPGGNAEPGSWQLCTKKGRDGRDGKDGKDAALAPR